ncbi:hypothetical protein CP978_11535 [Streptomyces nodosus]|uniref:Uncharacterized protein n=1 Tax=Streptomyces nodosus TaxID=40318 RepID=A0A5P2VZQ3_9ACTN|nr:hypothetical protein CP978_11535 [Streptomyces nodosus]
MRRGLALPARGPCTGAFVLVVRRLVLLGLSPAGRPGRRRDLVRRGRRGGLGGIAPAVSAVRVTGAVGTLVLREAVAAGARGTLGRIGTQLFDRGAASGAGEGAVEMSSARVAVVHDAGRLGSTRVTFLVSPVKVVW